MAGGGQRTALITGASSGIGLELATCFARDGYDLVLVARNAAALEALAGELRQAFGVSVITLPKDLSLRDTPTELVEHLTRSSVAVDVLVNNAGFGTHGAFAEADLTEQLEMMQVNMAALTHLTRLCLPGMLARRRGKILHVASTAAFQPGPLMAVYYATKAYVLSFSEALANELRGSGVTVTVLCPGPTQTNFQQRAGVAHIRVMSRRVMDARTVAEAGYRGLMRGKLLVIPGWRNRLLINAVRWLPRQLVTGAVRRLQEQQRVHDVTEHRSDVP